MSTAVYVVGAGIIGLATAFELCEQGVPGPQITVLDPEPAGGSTHHAGGMLAPAAEVRYRQEPLFPLMLDSAARYPSFLDRLAAVTDAPTGYRTEGTLVLAGDRADAEHLADLTQYQHVHGMRVERLTVREARRMEPALSPALAGAVYLPEDHQVSPRLLAAALRDALRSRGVKLRTEEVIAMERDAAGTVNTLLTRENRHDAAGSQVILANGLGAGRVSGWFEGEHPLHLRPVYGDILRLGVPGFLRPLITKVIRGFVEDRPVYLIPRSDGTLALGASSREDDQPEPRLGSVYDLIRDAVALVPGIEESTLLEATVGARPGTPDDLPYLGRAGDNLVISTGYFRHGILLAALGAQVGAQVALGARPDVDLSACGPFRHVSTSQF